MPSQLDLDQGGTTRQWQKSYLGPSVGWIYAPLQNVLAITTGATFILDPSVSLVTVNTTGSVTIVLPSAVDPAAGPQALPRLFANNPITIVDIGGNAAAHPITIQPKSGSENITGLSQIQITTNFGGYVLLPNSTSQGWNTP